MTECVLRQEPTLRYAIWSHGRLLGHLDLDTHQSAFIHGFIETTPLGDKVLPDATGVVVVTARRPPRREGAVMEKYLQEFQAAVDRREALDLTLVDEDGVPFDHDFIRVYDLRDEAYTSSGPCDDEEEMDDDMDEDIEEDVEPDDFDEWIAEDLALREESRMYGSTWEPPEDPRWETMQYYLQV